jgi:hypothetical protein
MVQFRVLLDTSFLPLLLTHKMLHNFWGHESIITIVIFLTMFVLSFFLSGHGLASSFWNHIFIVPHSLYMCWKIKFFVPLNRAQLVCGNSMGEPNY